ncbi:MAG: family 16 glycosylhydrolase, partial [Prevotellaceae bacterium]|nr:family 16 glycosylhydrolase [Prevotellaceae bacterium]
ALLKRYERYTALKDADALLRYRELAAQAASPRRLSGMSKREWKTMKREYKTLRKSAEVKEFFKLQKKEQTFHAITDWDVKFEDNFDCGSLDCKKWLDHYYVVGSKEGMDYSPANENHVYTNGANVSISNQTLKITTKREQIMGLGFSDVVGFLPVERECSSGIVNTGRSFCMKGGKVEAKIRFTQPSKHIYHAIWLSSGKKLPHVNVMRLGEKLEFSAFSESASAELQHVRLWPRKVLRQNSYYIITLEWNTESMVWKINGVPMFTAPNIVEEPMHIVFSSGATGVLPGSVEPALLEVDWVKAYQRHEQAAV